MCGSHKKGEGRIVRDAFAICLSGCLCLCVGVCRTLSIHSGTSIVYWKLGLSNRREESVRAMSDSQATGPQEA